MDECRKQFEEWYWKQYGELDDSLQRKYEFNAWQAAWNRREAQVAALAAQNRELRDALVSARGEFAQCALDHNATGNAKEARANLELADEMDKVLTLHDLSPEPLERFESEVIEKCLRCHSPDDSHQDWADKINALKKGSKE